jgi:hypothetical protein
VPTPLEVILRLLPKLSAADRAELRRRLEELTHIAEEAIPA